MIPLAALYREGYAVGTDRMEDAMKTYDVIVKFYLRVQADDEDAAAEVAYGTVVSEPENCDVDFVVVEPEAED